MSVVWTAEHKVHGVSSASAAQTPRTESLEAAVLSLTNKLETLSREQCQRTVQQLNELRTIQQQSSEQFKELRTVQQQIQRESQEQFNELRSWLQAISSASAQVCLAQQPCVKGVSQAAAADVVLGACKKHKLFQVSSPMAVVY